MQLVRIYRTVQARCNLTLVPRISETIIFQKKHVRDKMDTYVSLGPQVLFSPAMSTFRDIKKHPSAKWPFLVVPNNVIFKAAYRKHITRSDNTQSGVSGPQRDRGAVKKLASNIYVARSYRVQKIVKFGTKVSV